jgi:hypothetical protein
VNPIDFRNSRDFSTKIDKIRFRTQPYQKSGTRFTTKRSKIHTGQHIHNSIESTQSQNSKLSEKRNTSTLVDSSKSDRYKANQVRSSCTSGRHYININNNRKLSQDTRKNTQAHQLLRKNYLKTSTYSVPHINKSNNTRSLISQTFQSLNYRDIGNLVNQSQTNFNSKHNKHWNSTTTVNSTINNHTRQHKMSENTMSQLTTLINPYAKKKTTHSNRT